MKKYKILKFSKITTKMYEHNFLIIKLLGVCIILKSCAIVDCLIEMDIASKKASYMESQVGSYVVFNCALEFPHETEIPYILHWNKDVSNCLLITRMKI